MTSYLILRDWINIDKLNSSLLSKNSIDFFLKIQIKLIGIDYRQIQIQLNY